LAFGYVSAFIVALWLPCAYQHYAYYEQVSLLQICLSLFLCINLLICIWEIILFFYIETIRDNYQGKLKKLEPGDIGKIFLFQQVSLSEVIKPRYWTQVWVTYSLMDEGYSNTKSFGWAIDIGNGFSTLVPTVVFLLGMTLQQSLISPKWLGIVGLQSFYQEFYGTVVYFTQYVVNKRWEKHQSTVIQIILLVIVPNIIWIVFPVIGIYASIQLILQESFDVFV